MILVLSLCLVLLIGGFTALFVVYNQRAFAPATPTPRTGTVTTRTATPFVISTSPPNANDTLGRLLAAELPVNDANSIAPRLKGIALAPFATPGAPLVYAIGDRTSFWVSRDITGSYEFISATLKYQNAHTYIWLENGLDANENNIRRSGEYFENNIYPNDRKYLGSELTPGLDNDPRISILLTRFKNAAGYITSSDEYPRSIRPYSNEREMFYIDTGSVPPNTNSFNEVSAHEFAHLIHVNQNPQESSWIREGLGDLAIRLVISRTTPLDQFAHNPNLQLTGWTDQTPNVLAYYQAAYLFLSYGLDRFGIDYLRVVASSGTRDTNSIQRALDKYANGMRFDDFFADWVVANVVNNPLVANGKYSYKQDRPRITPRQIDDAPATISDRVHQYGTNYYELPDAKSELTLEFRGDAAVPVIPTTAHSGKTFWWSYRADLSDTSLTRAVDLTIAKSATLKFWTWYDTEVGFDYAYVQASSDDGKTWKTLEGKFTTDDDPNGANYGNGLTGKSGAARADRNAEPEWVQEQLDLSSFAGRKILLRFEYITDDIYVGAGQAIDDIEIPEIGWRDDAERESSEWQARGFVRIDNVIPQKFIVQVVEFGGNFKVERLALDASNRGTLTVKGIGGDVTRVIVAVSGATPVTWESANYQLNVKR